MEINLSEETINTIVNSLRASKQSLTTRIKHETQSTNIVRANKLMILANQLESVEDALAVFEEF